MLLVNVLFVVTSVLASNRRPEDTDSDQSALKKIKLNSLVEVDESVSSLQDTSGPRQLLLLDSLTQEVGMLLNSGDVFENSMEEDDTEVRSFRSEGLFDALFGLEHLCRDRKWRLFLGLERSDKVEWATLVKISPNIELTKALMADAVWSYVFPWDLMYQHINREIFSWGKELFEFYQQKKSHVAAYRILSCLFQMESGMEFYQDILSSEFMNIVDQFQLAKQTPCDDLNLQAKVKDLLPGVPEGEKKLLISFVSLHHSWKLFSLRTTDFKITPLIWRCLHGFGVQAELPCHSAFRDPAKVQSIFQKTTDTSSITKVLLKIAKASGLPSLTNVYDFQNIAYSPLFRYIVKHGGLNSWPLEFLSPPLLPLIQAIVPNFSTRTIPDDISSMIPALPPRFFAVNCIESMNLANIHALTVDQIDCYNKDALPRLIWTLLNAKVKEHLLKDHSRLLSMMDNLGSFNFQYLPSDVIISYMEKGLYETSKIYRRDALFRPEQKRLIFEHLCKRPGLVKSFNTIYHRENHVVDWRKTAELIKSWFLTENLPAFDGLDWNNPDLPIQFAEYGIEEHYGFSELFSGVPRGVWLAFFGFIHVPDDIWASLWRAEKVGALSLLMVATDPVFSMIFPWQRLLGKEKIDTLLCLLNLMMENLEDNLEHRIIAWRLFNTFHSLTFGREIDLKKISYRPIMMNYRNIPAATKLFNFKITYDISSRCPRKAKLTAIYHLCRHGASFLFDAAIIVDPNNISPKQYSCCTLNEIKLECPDVDLSGITTELWNKLFHSFSLYTGILEFWEKTGVLDRYYNVVAANMKRNYIIENLTLHGNAALRYFLQGSTPLVTRDSLLRLNDTAIISEFGDDFFAINKYNELPRDIMARITEAQLRRFDLPSLSMQSWSLLNDEVRTVLSNDLSFLHSLLISGESLFSQNYLFIPMDLFSNTIKTMSVEGIFELVGNENSIPTKHLNVIIERLISCKQVNIHPWVTKLSRSFLCEVLSKVNDIKFFSKSKRFISPTFMTLLRHAYEGSLNPVLSLYIQQQVTSNPKTLRCFLREPWTRPILDPQFTAKISPEELALISDEITGKNYPIVFESFYKNLFLHRHVFKGDLLKKALDVIFLGLFSSTPVTLEAYFWKRLPLAQFEAFILKYPAVGHLLHLNMGDFSKEQLEFIMTKMESDIEFLIIALTNAFEHKGLVLSKVFWNTESLLDRLLREIKYMSRNKYERLAVMSVLGTNMKNLSEQGKKKVYEVAKGSHYIIVGLLSASMPLCLPREFWEKVSDKEFDKLLKVYKKETVVYGDNRKNSYFVPQMQRNLQLNMGYMTEEQQLKFEDFFKRQWIASWLEK